jgi:glycosyltransferase involved in cell wall biosynthesis
MYNTLVRVLRLFKKHITCFIAPSEFMRGWLTEHMRINPNKITTISPAVDIPPSGADPAAGKYVAFAGRFTHEKGINTLLKAANLCHLPFSLCRHENNLVTMKIPSEVNVVITHNRAQLDDFYRGARMLVFPSIFFETFGLVGAEAMSHGIPVITSRIGALSELVQDGLDGLLFETGNPHDLADKVKRLWDDPELCRWLGRAARDKAASLWNNKRHFERHLAVYEDICRRS